MARHPRQRTRPPRHGARSERRPGSDGAAPATNEAGPDLQLSRHHLDILDHEFRTPLNFIVGFGSLLEDGTYGALPPGAREAATRILEGAGRLARLIEDLLEQTRITNGHLRLHPRLTDCREIFDALSTEFSPVAAARGVSLTARVAPDTPPLQVDPLRLHQALRHLVENALKFTPAGGAVGLEAAQGDGRVRLHVTDTGIGIPEACHKHIFDRFFQVDISLTRQHGGIGLGLAIVKGIVESLGGVIQVRSSPNEGARFTIELPGGLG